MQNGIATLLLLIFSFVKSENLAATDFGNRIWSTNQATSDLGCPQTFDLLRDPIDTSNPIVNPNLQENTERPERFQWSLRGMLILTALSVLPISVTSCLYTDSCRMNNRIMQGFHLDRYIEDGDVEHLKDSTVLSNTRHPSRRFVKALARLAKDKKQKEFHEFVSGMKKGGTERKNAVWTEAFRSIAVIPDRIDYLKYLNNNFTIDPNEIDTPLIANIAAQNDRNTFDYVMKLRGISYIDAIDIILAFYPKGDRYVLDRLFELAGENKGSRYGREQLVLKAALSNGNEDDFFYFLTKGLSFTEIIDSSTYGLAKWDHAKATKYLLENEGLSRNAEELLLKECASIQSFATLDVVLDHKKKWDDSFSIDVVMLDLFSHVKTPDVKLINHLVSTFGANIHYKDDRLLILAIKAGNSEMVDWLIERGANMDLALKKSIY